MYHAVIDQAIRWKVKEIVIEDAAAGAYLLPILRLEAPPGVPRPIAMHPDADKATRLHAEALVIEQGRVFLKTGAPWLKDLQLELAQFPRGKYSDQVDSISQFLKRAESRRLSGDRAERRPMFTWR
jgi:predicted phage terminase large subunit-like protein